MSTFGKKLQTLRKQRGITMRELAETLGFAASAHIASLESGRRRPSLDLAVKVADFFDVPIEQLARDDIDLD